MLKTHWFFCFFSFPLVRTKNLCIFAGLLEKKGLHRIIKIFRNEKNVPAIE